MKFGNSIIPILLLLGNGAVSSVAEEEEENGPPCRLYLGESQLSNDERFILGVYAGIDYDKGDLMPSAELGFPLVDFTDGIDRSKHPLYNKIFNFVESQVWTADYAGAKWEGNHSTLVALPGLGQLANYHSGTHNVDWDQKSALLRTGQLADTGISPGERHIARGAITNYYNLLMKATKKIPKGMELFANFGDSWDAPSSDGVNGHIGKEDNMFHDKINRYDYADADVVLDSIVEFMDKYQDQLKTIMEADNNDEDNKNLEDDVLDFILNEILGTAAGKHAKVIRSLIPAHPKKLKQVQELGGTFQYRNQDLIQTKKWLNRNAVCMDNIDIKRSTIPDAGRGAFSRRNLKKDDIIAPSPMMHITEAKVLDMYKINQYTTINRETGEKEVVDTVKDFSFPMGKQQIINYCFGHPESSLLLFPTGSQVHYINHAPTHSSTEGGPTANAYMTWSKQFNDHSLHDKSLKKLTNTNALAIVMNVVALHDIEEGEEIFIDYGPQWTSDWNAYKNYYDTTQRTLSDNWPLRAEDMRMQYTANVPYPVNLKKSQMPYPPNVATACFLRSTEVEDGRPMYNAKGNQILKFEGPPSKSEVNGLDMHICDLIERTEVNDDHYTDGTINKYNYTVIVKLNDDTIEQVESVPHYAITFVDLPYTSDMHIPYAFRHPIGIRDSDFPQAWRNLR